MTKLKNSLKVILLILLALAFIPLFTGASCDKTMETPLSRDDLDSIEHYHEPTIDEDFEDNIVYVILKSAFNSLEEISFKDIKIVEKVSKIDYVDLYTKEIPYSKDGIIPLGISNGHHMFRIVLEEHSKEKVLKVVGLLRSLDMVLISGPIYRGEVEYCWTPNDAKYSSQWGLNDEYGINMEKAWDITRGSLDVSVGLLEENVDMTHVDLEGRVFEGNFTPYGNKHHGTMVAGIIGAKQNEYAIAGIAECSMYLLSSSYSNFAKTIEYAQKNNIKIINASIVYKDTGFNDEHYEALKSYDGVFIAGAGNDGLDIDNYELYPASYNLPNVITVGALTSAGKKWNSSNYGKNSVDLFAPGADVYSTDSSNTGYNIGDGTSYAAPHVVGVAALIYAKYPYLTGSEVKKAILDNVHTDDVLKDLKDKCVTGGILDAYHALLNADNYHTEAYQHNENNRHDLICRDCGYIISTGSYTEYYQYRNENQHEVICNECKTISNNSITIRIEAHTFKPYVSGNKNNKLTGKICTGCYYILYDNGFGSIITKDEDKE